MSEFIYLKDSLSEILDMNQLDISFKNDNTSAISLLKNGGDF
jgi:hypothetical protein